MKLIITFPILEEKEGIKYEKNSYENLRLLESWVWKQGGTLGQHQLTWNNVYNFWDLKCLPITKIDEVNFEKLEVIFKSMDLEKFESMTFTVSGFNGKGMRYWLYPKKEYGAY